MRSLRFHIRWFDRVVKGEIVGRSISTGSSQVPTQCDETIPLIMTTGNMSQAHDGKGVNCSDTHTPTPQERHPEYTKGQVLAICTPKTCCAVHQQPSLDQTEPRDHDG